MSSLLIRAANQIDAAASAAPSPSNGAPIPMLADASAPVNGVGGLVGGVGVGTTGVGVGVGVGVLTGVGVGVGVLTSHALIVNGHPFSFTLWIPGTTNVCAPTVYGPEVNGLLVIANELPPSTDISVGSVSPANVMIRLPPCAVPGTAQVVV